MRIEIIHETLAYGKIIRLRELQCWFGSDNQGNYIDIHLAEEEQYQQLLELVNHSPKV